MTGYDKPKTAFLPGVNVIAGTLWLCTLPWVPSLYSSGIQWNVYTTDFISPTYLFLKYVLFYPSAPEFYKLNCFPRDLHRSGSSMGQSYCKILADLHLAGAWACSRPWTLSGWGKTNDTSSLFQHGSLFFMLQLKIIQSEEQRESSPSINTLQQL